MHQKISIKTPDQIKIMQTAGSWAGSILDTVTSSLRVGMSTLQVDNMIEDMIIAKGGESSFKKVAGYRHSSCICINEQIVHTPPSNQIIKDGDVVCVDMGVYLRGFHTDVADTVVVGLSNDRKNKFLSIGKKTLDLAIAAAKEDLPIAAISSVIWENINGAGYHIVPSLTGHGVGRQLHEAPSVPGYVTSGSKNTFLRNGMTIAVEIIYSENKGELVNEKGDDWSLIVKDGGLTACFEKTILIQGESPLVITPY